MGCTALAFKGRWGFIALNLMDIHGPLYIIPFCIQSHISLHEHVRHPDHTQCKKVGLPRLLDGCSRKLNSLSMRAD